jgi:hypothetical protein
MFRRRAKVDPATIAKGTALFMELTPNILDATKAIVEFFTPTNEDQVEAKKRLCVVNDAEQMTRMAQDVYQCTVPEEEGSPTYTNSDIPLCVFRGTCSTSQHYQVVVAKFGSGSKHCETEFEKVGKEAEEEITQAVAELVADRFSIEQVTLRLTPQRIIYPHWSLYNVWPSEEYSFPEYDGGKCEVYFYCGREEEHCEAYKNKFWEWNRKRSCHTRVQPFT